MRNTTHIEIGRFAPVLICGALFFAGCANNASIPPVAEPSPSPKDERTACEQKFSDRVDQVVTVTGKFSLTGKLGPLILIDNDCAIYLLSDQRFDWNDDKYTAMEGKSVRVTGTLRFKSYPDEPPSPVPVGRAPDHFYLDPRISTMELTEVSSKK